MIDYAHQHHVLDECVRGEHREESVAALRRYFGQRRYTGRWFERFAGGGDGPSVADTVTEADVSMHSAPWSTYEKGSPAFRLWELFRQCGGKHRPVTASKLLARKRPRLTPVYDSQVRAILKAPASPWNCLWSWFHTDTTRHPRWRSCARRRAGSRTSPCSAAWT